MKTIDADAILTGATGAIQDPGDVQASAPALISEADGDTDAERLDGTAGCEFVDDRIRVPE
jgi:hypothetical protein